MLTLGCFGYILKGYTFHLNLYVYTIHQRTTNLVHISLNLNWRADTLSGGMMVIPTGTRVHRGNQHEGTRQCEIISRSRYSDDTVFKGLAKRLQHISVELWQFIQKEHTIVSQTDFTRHEDCASSYQSHIRYRVMRCSEWSLTDERSLLLQFTRNGVDLCCF